jgi:RNA polymerase sigma factor (sigma-70 family)
MVEASTTAVVQRYLSALGDGANSDEIIHELLGRAVDRLRMLCGGMLRNYGRLTQGPLNLEGDELLSVVVERLCKALRKVRPETPRQFFALANQHIRWSLNDFAEWLDRQPSVEPVSDVVAPAPLTADSLLSPQLKRILQAMESLPTEESEVFDLIKVQGLTQVEAAELLGVATKTIQRRLNRAVLLLSDQLGDMVAP